jgi:hypothetical protein
MMMVGLSNFKPSEESETILFYDKKFEGGTT